MIGVSLGVSDPRGLRQEEVQTGPSKTALPLRSHVESFAFETPDGRITPGCLPEVLCSALSVASKFAKQTNTAAPVALLCSRT